MKVGMLLGKEMLKNLIIEQLSNHSLKELFVYNMELFKNESMEVVYVYEDMVKDIDASTLVKESRQNGIRMIYFIKSDKTQRINEFIEEGIYDILTGEFDKSEIKSILNKPKVYEDVNHLLNAELEKKPKSKKKVKKEIDKSKPTILSGIFKRDKKVEKMDIVDNDIEEVEVNKTNHKEYAFEEFETKNRKTTHDFEVKKDIEQNKDGEDQLNNLLSKMQSNDSLGVNNFGSVKTKAEKEAEYKDRMEEDAERGANEDVERKLKEDAERKSKEDAERKAKEDAERKLKEDVERKLKEDAGHRVKEDTERKVKEDVECKAKEDAERKLKEDVERKSKEDAERKVKEDAERKAKEDAERKLKEDTGHRAKEDAERKSKEEAERKVKEDTERELKEEAERKAKEDAERKVKEDAERKAKEEAEHKAKEEKKRLKNIKRDVKFDQVNKKRILSKGVERIKPKKEKISATNRISKSDQKLNGHTTISIMGVDNGVGTTHSALMICYSYSRNNKVAYVDFSNNDKFKYFKEQFDIAEKKNKFSYHNVHFYNDKSIYHNIKDYDLVVFDLGNYKNNANQMTFKMTQHKFVMGDSNLSNQKKIFDFSKTYKETYKDYTYILKTASKEEINGYKSYIDTKKVYTIDYEKDFTKPSRETIEKIHRIIRS